ncbi:MAG: hypothetical protein ACT6RU_14535 [Aliihoeflea sp.]|uniref:hypothetical protein n=1 Tax=Aliihoeflea sp. TaxID=2608088 RepID=UPI0040338945
MREKRALQRAAGIERAEYLVTPAERVALDLALQQMRQPPESAAVRKNASEAEVTAAVEDVWLRTSSEETPLREEPGVPIRDVGGVSRLIPRSTEARQAWLMLFVCIAALAGVFGSAVSSAGPAALFLAWVFYGQMSASAPGRIGANLFMLGLALAVYTLGMLSVRGDAAEAPIDDWRTTGLSLLWSDPGAFNSAAGRHNGEGIADEARLLMLGGQLAEISSLVGADIQPDRIARLIMLDKAVSLEDLAGWAGSNVDRIVALNPTAEQTVPAGAVIAIPFISSRRR